MTTEAEKAFGQMVEATIPEAVRMLAMVARQSGLTNLQAARIIGNAFRQHGGLLLDQVEVADGQAGEPAPAVG